jgi:hypothetical protein
MREKPQMSRSELNKESVPSRRPFSGSEMHVDIFHFHELMENEPFSLLGKDTSRIVGHRFEEYEKIKVE